MENICIVAKLLIEGKDLHCCKASVIDGKRLH